MELDGAADPHRVEGKDEEPKYLPPEVMEKIIKHCKAPVLLQLRLVSATMKTLVDTSTPFKELLNNLEVNLHVSTLEEFVTSAPSLPFTRFYIDPCPPTGHLCPIDSPYCCTTFLADIHFPPFYADSPQLQTFKQKFCPKIRRLRLSACFSGTTHEELNFLESLSVLEELDIRILRLLYPDNSEEGQPLDFNTQRIPNIPALKRLSVGVQSGCEDYLNNWIASCPSLVHLKFPREYEASYILQLGSAGHLPNLQSLHMNSSYFERPQWTAEDLDFLRELTSRRDFRLEGVSARVLSSVTNAPQVPPEVKRAFLSCVVASQEFWERLGDLENLEELQFGSDPHSPNSGIGYEDVEFRVNGGIFRLPSLKKITAEILSVEHMTQRNRDVVRRFVERLFRPTHPRLSVTHLDIAYFGVSDIPIDSDTPNFTPEHLHLGFPNLTKLKLKLWGFPFNRMVDLIRLFDVLSEKPLLEELHLCSWDRIHEGNLEAAFTGRNPPGLLKLKHLKKLRLDTPSFPDETVDSMGDGILGVIAQMTLTHLHISGKGWTNVTGDGLRTLTEGPLGQTILWTQLKDLGASLEAEERREVFEGLSRVCHSNRFARGLTSVSFQQFQTSEAAFLQTEHPFRCGGWTDQELYL